MGIAQLRDIIDELFRKLSIGVVLLKAPAFPGTKVHFVDEHGFLKGIGGTLPFLPLMVTPAVLPQVGHFGSGLGLHLRPKGVWVSL